MVSSTSSSASEVKSTSTSSMAQPKFKSKLCLDLRVNPSLRCCTALLFLSRMYLYKFINMKWLINCYLVVGEHAAKYRCPNWKELRFMWSSFHYRVNTWKYSLDIFDTQPKKIQYLSSASLTGWCQLSLRRRQNGRFKFHQTHTHTHTIDFITTWNYFAREIELNDYKWFVSLPISDALNGQPAPSG